MGNNTSTDNELSMEKINAQLEFFKNTNRGSFDIDLNADEVKLFQCKYNEKAIFENLGKESFNATYCMYCGMDGTTRRSIVRFETKTFFGDFKYDLNGKNIQ